MAMDGVKPLENYPVLQGKSVTQDIESHARIEELVSRAQNGDKDAFTLLYQEYVQQIYRYIYIRVGNHTEQAEDFTQDVFFKALKNLDRYRYNGTPFKSWLFRIAHNIIIDYYRKNKKGRDIILTEAMTLVADNDIVNNLERSMEILEIKQAIEKLPAQQREVLSLRFGTGLSVAETAMAMGKTKGTVKKLQYIALAKLRKLIEK